MRSKLERNVNVRFSQKDMEGLEKIANEKRIPISTFCRMELTERLHNHQKVSELL